MGPNHQNPRPSPSHSGKFAFHFDFVGYSSLGLRPEIRRFWLASVMTSAWPFSDRYPHWLDHSVMCNYINTTLLGKALKAGLALAFCCISWWYTFFYTLSAKFCISFESWPLLKVLKCKTYFRVGNEINSRFSIPSIFASSFGLENGFPSNRTFPLLHTTPAREINHRVILLG